MAHRFWLMTLFVSLAAAQNPADLFQKAPPDVDAALRSRIGEFYQDHVDAKFRQAEALVAEDSKDFYYSANKPKYLNYKITRIEYSNHFTKAKATVVCEMFMPVEGFMGKPFPAPIPSYWKLENGKWYWYVDAKARSASPMGQMKEYNGPAAPGASGPAMMPDMGNLAALAQNIMDQVKADKSSVELSGSAAQTVTITNGMPGAIQIAIEDGPPGGVEATLDRKDLKAGEKAVLTLRARSGAQPHSGLVTVRVVQTNHLIPVQIVAK